MTSKPRKRGVFNLIFIFFLDLFCLLLGGAWLVAYRAEQRRRFKAVLCSGEPSVPAKPVVITELKEEELETIEDEKPPKLDGFYLVSLWIFQLIYLFCVKKTCMKYLVSQQRFQSLSAQ